MLLRVQDVQKQKRNEARSLLKWQLIFLFLLPIVLLVFDKTIAYSGFLGGLLAVVASSVMSLMVFRQYRAQEPEKVLAKFYSAEIVKIMITVTGFMLIIVLVNPLSFVTLIIVYFIIQILPAVLINYG